MDITTALAPEQKLDYGMAVAAALSGRRACGCVCVRGCVVVESSLNDRTEMEMEIVSF